MKLFFLAANSIRGTPAKLPSGLGLQLESKSLTAEKFKADCSKTPSFWCHLFCNQGEKPQQLQEMQQGLGWEPFKTTPQATLLYKRMKDPPSPREETWKPPFQHRSPHNEAEVSKAAPITLSKVSLCQSILVRRRFAFQSASFRLFLIPVVTPWKLAQYL